MTVKPLPQPRITVKTQAHDADAIAPYHPTAVGIYTRLPRQTPPPPEDELYTFNVAILHAAYQVFSAAFPQYQASWDEMMEITGLDANDTSICTADDAKCSAAAIGNAAGLGPSSSSRCTFQPSFVVFLCDSIPPSLCWMLLVSKCTAAVVSSSLLKSGLTSAQQYLAGAVRGRMNDGFNWLGAYNRSQYYPERMGDYTGTLNLDVILNLSCVLCMSCCRHLCLTDFIVQDTSQ